MVSACNFSTPSLLQTKPCPQQAWTASNGRAFFVMLERAKLFIHFPLLKIDSNISTNETDFPANARIFRTHSAEFDADARRNDRRVLAGLSFFGTHSIAECTSSLLLGTLRWTVHRHAILSFSFKTPYLHFLFFFIFDQKKEKITVPRDYFASKTLRRKKFQKGSFCPSSVYVVVGVCVCVCVCLFVRMFV